MYESLNVCRRVRFSPFGRYRDSVGPAPSFTLTLRDDARDAMGNWAVAYRLTYKGTGRAEVVQEGTIVPLRDECSDSDSLVCRVMTRVFESYGMRERMNSFSSYDKLLAAFQARFRKAAR